MPDIPTPYNPLGVDSSRVPDFWLYRCLRRLSGILAHILALGFTVFLIILARPGTTSTYYHPYWSLSQWRLQSKLKQVHNEEDSSSGTSLSLFSWHPIFMAVAFCLCMTEAVLLLSPETSPLCPLSRKSKTRLHWLVQLCVPLLAGIGFAFIVCSKNRSEQLHMTSWHSILGVFTLGATFCQAVCGLALLCPRLARISAVSRLKLYHATCGLLVYLLATSTVLLGLCSDWFQAQIKGPVWYICLALPLYPALIIMNQVLDIYLPKRKVEM
uniref:ascorbate ferrireductase (transmembrane) n=1 Tax=Xenopus tropicalis TaxID=8364 RepID=A0A803JGK9_XENTR